FFIW
ncbi:hypothetical protein N499_0898B, partial [Wolbachia pipientis wVitA]